MKLQSHRGDRGRDSQGKARVRAGFTFAEVLVAVAVIGTLAGSSIWAMSQINTYASVNRLYTGAETVAQNRIDEILSESPFNPQNGDSEIPDVIRIPLRASGNTATDTTLPQIYNEPNPAGGTPRIIYGSLQTKVSKVAATGTNGIDLNLYQATVIVSYNYRGKAYKVQLNAMRSSDI